MSKNIEDITGSSFQTAVLEAELPVLVDFWAEWCNPCKAIAPIVEKIANDYQGKLKVVKFNVDQDNEIAAKYNILGIPTLILFNKGEVVATRTGALTESQLVDFLNDHLNA